MALLGHLHRRLGTVRMRATLAAALVFIVALVIAGAVALGVLRRTLTDDVRASARAHAHDLVASIEGGFPPRDVGSEDDDESLVQVIDASGQVVASSRNVAGEPPVVAIDAGASRRIDRTPFDDDPFLVVAASADGTNGPALVVVGRALDGVDDAYGVVLRILVLGGPVLVLVVALLTWWVVGRSLAPVDAMRRETEAVTAQALHRRITTPDTDDEIAQLATTLNRMLDRLEAAQVRQRQFVADASHELRSPIATIREHAEIALAHPGRTTTEALASVVLDADRRLGELVADLLLLARAEEPGPSHQRVDLDDLVFEEVRRVRAAEPGLRIDPSGVSAGRVSGDPRQLRRLVGNLLDNAARHAAGEVAVSLRTAADTVVLAVDDDGPGVPEADRDRIFERFVRLDRARSRDAGGSGLGLAIVLSVAVAHGGTVRAGASSLGGARFEVRLPAVDDSLPPFSDGQGRRADDDAVPTSGTATAPTGEGAPTWRSGNGPR